MNLADNYLFNREQFNGLAKIFGKATIDKHNLLTNPPSLPSSTLLVDQDVTYYRDASKSPTKTMNSLLTVERDSNGKVVRLQEEVGLSVWLLANSRKIRSVSAAKLNIIPFPVESCRREGCQRWFRWNALRVA